MKSPTTKTKNTKIFLKTPLIDHPISSFCIVCNDEISLKHLLYHQIGFKFKQFFFGSIKFYSFILNTDVTNIKVSCLVGQLERCDDDYIINFTCLCVAHCCRDLWLMTCGFPLSKPTILQYRFDK